MTQSSHPAALYQLRKVTRIIALAILGLVFLGFFLPSDYRIERSVKVNAPLDLVSQNIFNGDYLPEWMFIQKGRLNVFSGELSVGQSVAISYDESDAQGQLTLTGLSNSNIRFDVQPKEGVNIVTNNISLSSVGDEVLVTWAIQGQLDAGLLGPYLAFFANDIAGKNFEISLDRLKAQMEQLDR
ncbi:polyketide cyclase [Marinomonas sp. C2222]|uniref:Polyketide cyclase n=1 Tax=Marinomonas sargassi TaxID=2984494 RepID=A0ABT2YTW1_9GAMM|nr:polyketide cyclase [Marinomonas sargassi]MCV2403049.1 polyketide cyclase [Marinomonas sargassi]